MSSVFDEKIKVYSELNRLAEKHKSVFFGCDVLARLDVFELSNSFHLNEIVYNRSFEGMGMADAQMLLEECVLPLAPSKVFTEISAHLSIEKADDIESYLSRYEWLLYTIHTKCRGEICIVFSDSTHELIKQKLSSLAREHGCAFIDITAAKATDSPELSVFQQLKHHLRTQAPDFCEAMNSVSL